MKRVVILAASVAGALSLALIAWTLRGPLVMLLLAAALSAAAKVIMDALEERGLSRGLALAVTYGSAVVLLAAAVMTLAGPLLSDLRGSAESLARAYERLSARLPEGGAVSRLLASYLPSPQQLTRSNPTALAGDALSTSSWLLERVGALLIILILSLHWSAARDRLGRFAMYLIPAHRRAWTRLVFNEMEAAVGRQLAGGLLKGYLALVILAIGFRAAGVPYPTLLAVLVAVLTVVPLVGMLLGPTLVLIACWSSAPGAVTQAALAALGTAALMLLVNRVVAPRMLEARRSNTILQVVVLLVLARAVGPLGLLAAPAVAAILHIAVERLAMRRAALRDNSIEGMRRRLEELRGQSLAPELASVADSLELLADEAERMATRPAVVGPSGPSSDLPRQPPTMLPPRAAAG